MPKRIAEKEIFKTKIFTIKDVELEFNDGKKLTRQILEKPNTAIIVPLTANGDLVLIKEYFTALDEYQLDLPGGRIDLGMNELETANKELQEEIGYKAGRLDKIGEFTMSPGYLTQRSYVFVARDLTESRLKGDEEEPLEVIKHPFDKFEELIDSSQLTEARAIAALYLARRFISTA